MGIFGRKQKEKSGTNPSSEKRVEGIVRRGLTGTDGDLPLARLETLDSDAEGRSFNPYESVSTGAPVARKDEASRQAADPRQDWRESGFNPYDTYSNLPKPRSWEDVPFDSVDKDRRGR
jgi:hypothetical protein